MKRILAVLLIAVLVVGMLPFAAGAVTPTAIIGMSGNANILDPKYIQDFGTIILGIDKNILDIPVHWQNFDFGGAAGTPADVTQEIINNCKLVFSDPRAYKLFEQPSWKHSTADGDVFIRLTAMNIGEVDGDVRLVYNDGYTTPTESIPVPIKGRFVDPTINKEITGHKDVQLGSKGVLIDGKKTNNMIADLVSTRPGTEVMFVLDTDFFEWDPDITQSNSAVRKASLDNDHITVIKDIIAGRDIIKEVVIENVDGRAYVIVRFIEDYDKTEGRDYDIKISLGTKGVRHTPSTVQLYGTLENEVWDVYKETDYVFLGDGAVADAHESAKKIKVDLGGGVTLHTNMIAGKKYRARINESFTDGDLDVTKQFPEIRRVLRVSSNSINENNVQSVTMDLDRNYYVYDANGKYLGRSQDTLVFRNKYYLGIEPIPLQEEVVPDDLIDGDDYNGNPSTGGQMISGFPKAMLGLAVLVIGALALKKRDEQ